jgi:hypothetical protein
LACFSAKRLPLRLIMFDSQFFSTAMPKKFDQDQTRLCGSRSRGHKHGRGGQNLASAIAHLIYRNASRDNRRIHVLHRWREAMPLIGNDHAITVLTILLVWGMVVAAMCATDPSAGLGGPDTPSVEWQCIANAPNDRDLELAVINYDGIHALVFPCRRVLEGWTNTETKEKLIGLLPTHWRKWQAS